MGMNMKHKYAIYTLIFSMLLLFSSCDYNVENTTESATNETTAEPTEAPTERDPTHKYPSSAPKPNFCMSNNQEKEISSDATGVHFYMTARAPGVSVRWADSWNLYRIEDGQRKYVGGMAQESSVEKPPTAADQYAFVYQHILFVDLVGSQNLPAGEYELVYVMDGELSSEFIRFTVKE